MMCCSDSEDSIGPHKEVNLLIVHWQRNEHVPHERVGEGWVKNARLAPTNVRSAVQTVGAVLEHRKSCADSKERDSLGIKMRNTGFVVSNIMSNELQHKEHYMSSIAERSILGLVQETGAGT